MKDNNLEKHFRDRFKNLEAGPPDGSKEAIEKHLLDAGLLKEKAETKGGLWMFVLLALLIATPVVYALRKTHKVQLAENTTAKNNSESATSESTTAIVYTDNKNEKVNVNGNKAEATNVSTTHPHDNVNAGTKRTKSINHSKTKIQTETAAFVQPTNIKWKKKTTATTEAKPMEPENSSPALADNSTNTIPAISSSLHTDADNNENAGSSSAELKTEPDKLEEKKDTLTEKDEIALKDTTKHPKAPAEKIHKEIAFDFSGAPQFNSIVYGNGSQYYQQYVDESRRSEKETPSFSAAFGLVVSLNRFIIETGIKHSILSSDFSFAQTLITFDTTRSHSSPGGWVHIDDSIETTTHYIANNKIAFMEFPLLVGYRLRKGKFEFEIKAGPMMSFITSASTTVISLNTGTVIQSNDLENSPYRKTCWSILSAGDILYLIDNRFSAFVQPSLKSGITSVFKESAPVTKKVQSVSVGIGIRVKL